MSYNKQPLKENNIMTQGHNKLRPQKARRLAATNRWSIVTGEEWWCYRVKESLVLVKVLNKLS